jgi:hypothetical protein
MNGRLLMAHQHVLDAVLLVERVVDVEDRASGVAPEEFHAFGLKAADQNFRAVRLRVEGLRLRQGGAFDFRGRHIHVEPL